MPPSDRMKTTRTLTEMARVVVPAAPVQTGPLNLVPWVMEMRVVGTPVTLQINVRDHMLIGRADSERGINPEIDLTEPDGIGKGVSRRTPRSMFTTNESMCAIWAAPTARSSMASRASH